MKRLLIALLLMSSSLASVADNYFTLGENDTLRINPGYLGSTVIVPVRAHFDGRLDQWILDMGYPGEDTLKIKAVIRGTDMDVPYIDSSGESSVHEANLSVSSGFSTIYSLITDIGYWDWNNSGNYAPYGTIKWEAGDYPAMFYLQFEVKNPIECDTITINGTLASDGDARGGIVSYAVFYSLIEVVMGYMLGDVNGDEVVDMTDVTLLISVVQSGTILDAYQQEAADMNGDGIIEITDITLLIQKVLTGA